MPFLVQPLQLSEAVNAQLLYIFTLSNHHFFQAYKTHHHPAMKVLALTTNSFNFKPFSLFPVFDFPQFHKNSKYVKTQTCLVLR